MRLISKVIENRSSMLTGLLSICVLVLCQADLAAQEGRKYRIHLIGPETAPSDVNFKFSIIPYIDEDEAIGGPLSRQNTKAFGWSAYRKEHMIDYVLPDHVGTVRTVQINLWATSSKNLIEGYWSYDFGKDRRSPFPASGSVILVKYDLVRNSQSEIEDGSAPLIQRPYVPKVTHFITTSIELDKKIKYVEVKETPPFRVPKGAIERKREEYTVKHTVNLQQNRRVEGSADVSLFSFLNLGIRGSIEQFEGKTYEQSKATVREIEIVGGNSPIKLVWIETYRTGRAIVHVNNERSEIPFEFRDGWDLQTREVNE